VSLGTTGTGTVRKPGTVIWLAVAGVPITLLVGIACYYAIGFGLGTGCTDRYGNASPQRCAAMYDWLTAGLAGQLIIAGALIVLLVVGLSSPSRRGAGIAVMTGSLALTVIWGTLTSLAASRSF
jgi:hypothetical protein